MVLLDKLKNNYDLGIEPIRNNLKEYGVSLVKNLVTQEMLAPVLSEIKAFAKVLANSLQEDLSSNEQEIDSFFARIISKYPHLQSTIYDRLGKLLSLHAFPSQKEILNFSEHILGTKNVGLWWPRIQIRLDTYEDHENLIGWHHDYLYNKGTVDSYTFWIPLVKLDKSMGLLKFIPYSHKRDYQFAQNLERRHSYDLAHSLEEEDIAEFPQYSPGDLLIFHSKLVHTGQVNKTPDRVRMVILYRMQNLEKLEEFHKEI